MSAELLAVKPFQETLYTNMCGPAVLKMVFGYYGLEKTEQELSELCGNAKNLSTDDHTIKKIAESFGFKIEIQNLSTVKDIKTWLDKKIPVIVDWFTRGRQDYDDSEVPDGHYSVVIGLDDENIYLQDPEIGRLRTLKIKDFMRVWFDFREEVIVSWENMIIRQIIAIHK